MTQDLENTMDIETTPPPQQHGGSALHDATCSAWIRTADQLPGEIGGQADIIMWSPEWATWLKGMVTRWSEEDCEWAIYNQQDDRYHEWSYVPEFWMAPILPNAKRIDPPTTDSETP